MYKNIRELKFVLNADEMREVDRNTISRFGILGLELMARAGVESASILLEAYSVSEGDTIAIVCGVGNNGGDGFFAARHLHQAKRLVRVYLIGDSSKQSEDAREAQRLLEDAGVVVEKRLPSDAELRNAKIVVDALFGIGFRGPVRDSTAQAISAMNRAERPILSLDIPSGLSSNSVTIPDIYVRAEITVAFGYAKISQMIEPTKSLMGHLKVVDIGFPPEVVEKLEQPTTLLNDQTLPLDLLRRKAYSHKGTYGHVLVIGGSRGMYGAPILAAQAALHAGAGLVTVVFVSGEDDIIPAIAPEIMVQRIVDKRGCFHSDHLTAVIEIITRKKINCLVLGMGLGSAPETVPFSRGILACTQLPIVVDADGLHALAFNAAQSKNQKIIATPHAGEYRKAFGEGHMLEELENPISHIKARALTHGLTIVHKSATTIIADAQGQVFINTSGNPGMATAGMGDTLAGVIGAFCAQGIPPSESARLGVYLHGVAGDRCALETGEIGVTSTGVATRIGRALQFAVNPLLP
jgi:NAD(P)H-hydrate epimerase